MIVILLLLVAMSQGASDDAYIRGYAEAVLRREFPEHPFRIDVHDGVVTIHGVFHDPKDRRTYEEAVSSLPGVTRVVFRPPREVPQATGEWSLFPEWHLFAPLLADPRDPHLSAAYRYHANHTGIARQAGAVSFGQFFSLVGYDPDGPALFQLGLDAGVFAVFDLEADSYDLVNADYLVGLPLSFEFEPISARLRLSHQSSHLGDEFLLRTGIDRVDLSYEGIDARVDYRFEGFRIYAGGGFLVHTAPEDFGRGSVQAGVELDPASGWLGGAVDPVVAVDFQWIQETDWLVDLSVRAGLAFRNPSRGRQRVLLLLEYYRGRNPDGQFFDEQVRSFGFGIHIYY